MKLKISEVLSATIGLVEIAKVKMPVTVGFKLARLIKIIRVEAETATAELNKLLPEYGVEMPDTPGTFTIAPDKRAGYVAAVKALHDTEIDVAVESVELPDTLEVSPSALVAVGELVRLKTD